MTHREPTPPPRQPRGRHSPWAIDPGLLFVAVLVDALAARCCHVASRSGDAPAHPERWGWKRTVREYWILVPAISKRLKQYGEEVVWRPRGPRIGWVDDNCIDLFLDSRVALTVARQLAGDGVAVTTRTLHKHLAARGLLCSTDPTHGTFTVQRVIAGAKRQVLHLWAPTMHPAVVRLRRES